MHYKLNVLAFQPQKNMDTPCNLNYHTGIFYVFGASDLTSTVSVLYVYDI